MTYRDFLNKVAKETEELMDGYTVSVMEVRKANHPDGLALSIKGESDDVAMVFYAEDYYREYLNRNVGMEGIAREVAGSFGVTGGRPVFDFGVSDFMDFEKVKEKITCRLINHDLNEVMLEDVPHTPFLDMEIVYYYVLDENKCVMIRNSRMEMWDVTVPELHKIATRNTREMYPARFCGMMQMLMETMGMPLGYDDDEGGQYVLTNSKAYYGAIGLTDDGNLAAIAEKLGDDFYALPSSVHEAIIIPVSNFDDVSDLREIVGDVNGNPDIITADDFLSNSVYRFYRATRRLEIAA